MSIGKNGIVNKIDIKVQVNSKQARQMSSNEASKHRGACMLVYSSYIAPRSRRQDMGAIKKAGMHPHGP
jgi:hypothetical protein